MDTTPISVIYHGTSAMNKPKESSVNLISKSITIFDLAKQTKYILYKFLLWFKLLQMVSNERKDKCTIWLAIFRNYKYELKK